MAKTLTSAELKPGDKVIDKTAEKNQWPDVEGEVLQTDGPHVQVKYTSGNIRAKLAINLRLKDEDIVKDDDPTVCQITGKSIVNPPATLQELAYRIKRAAKTSPAAQIRQLFNDIDPRLN